MWGSTFGVLSVARLARITLLLLLVLGCWQECSGYDKQGRVGTADRIVRQRLVQLKRIAKLRTRQYHCNHQKIIRITEIPFGNSGNNLIEFTHGLWVAKHLNGTLLVPHWIAHILKPFDTTLLRSMFCYVLLDQFDEKNPPANTAFVDITSEDSFFLFKIFSMPEYKGMFPELNSTMVSVMSEHFLLVYAALWSSALPHLVSSSIWIIENRMHNSLRYTSAHKRSLEGGCNKLMATSLDITEFSPYQLPMNNSEFWNKNTLAVNHPLCEMRANFVLETMTMNHRNGSQIFLAFDGRGDISDYEAIDVVLSKHFAGADKDKISAEMKFLDMFIAMHGDFFVLNPLSTFSWEIYLIRLCLGLESVPVVETRDIYFMTPTWWEYYKRRPTDWWVSWTSVIDAHNLLLH
jgi:hypothetical protein